MVFGRICLKMISNKTLYIIRIKKRFLNENNQNNNDDLLDDNYMDFEKQLLILHEKQNLGSIPQGDQKTS